MIAHRGASGLAPENTLAAFALAVRLEVDGVEMDVRLSSDRVPVVIHDARTDRTTNRKGAVASLTAAQLGDLDAGSWFDRRLALRPRTRALARLLSGVKERRIYAGETVPTLQSALELLAPAHPKRIYIELKSDAGERLDLVEAVVRVARRFRLAESLTFLSFDHESVALVKRSWPGVRTAVTFAPGRRPGTSVGAIVAAARITGADEIALHHGLVTKRNVAALHRNDLEVSAWTANSRVIMRRLIATGVDSIMSDHPLRLKRILESSI